MQDSTKRSIYYVLMWLSTALAAGSLFALVGYKDHDSFVEEYSLGMEEIIGLAVLLVVASFFSYYYGTKYYRS